MSWRDELRRGSFRGIRLDFADLSVTGGKRLVVDEYPEQDDHTVDELGRRAHRFRVGAVLAGDDYLDTRDRLIAAIEEAGPGTLVHPWRGTLQVHAGDFEVTHQGHGSCLVSWDCVIATGTTAPVVAVDAEAVVVTAAAAATAQAGAASDRSVTRRAALPTYYRTAVNAGLAEFAAVWDDPIGEAFAALTGSETGEETLEALFGALDDIRELLAIARGYPLGSPRYTLGTAETPSEVAAGGVLADFWRSFRAGALARACVVAAGTTYATATAAESDMRAIGDAIADELEETLDGDLFDALIDLRAAIIASLSQIAERLPLEQEIEIATQTPAIVIAFDRYEDPTRDAEIVLLNSIASPLLVVGRLTVLSE